MYVIGVFDDPNKDLKHIKEERNNFQDIMSTLQIEEDFKRLEAVFSGKPQ